MSWWHPDRISDRKPFLDRRRRIQKAVRDAFEAEGFCEVETPILQVSPGNETHLHAFATQALSLTGEARPLMLRTSPEFAAKKLLAGGMERLFEFAKVFRNRESGPLHASEFTMLEWYRAHQDYTLLMEDCATLLKRAGEAAKTDRFTYRGCFVPVDAEPERITLAQAFHDHAGIDLLAVISASGETDTHAFRAAIEAAGIRTAMDDTWSDLFSKVLVEKIEPHLGRERPCFLYEYPIPEAALARPCARDPRVAERFELYLCGVELANAFGELTDAKEQRRRFEAAMAEKLRLYGESYPLDEDFLAAVAAMPPASGAALGFDRLVMLATGASRIDQVMWAPV